MKVSGLNMHKDTVFCAIYEGKKQNEVKEFSTFTENIKKLGEMLQEQEVKRIAMESTSIYWVPVWNILEDMGFELILVNPYSLSLV